MFRSRGRRSVRSLVGALVASALAVLLPAAAPGVARASVPPPPMVTSPIDFSGSYPIDGLPPFAHRNRIGYVSCASSSMCVALDDNGNILTSTDPASSNDSWRITPLPIYDDSGLQCPTTNFCAGIAASDENGEGAVLTSTDPTGGPDAWQVYQAPSGASLNNISCPSAAFCAGVDGNEIFTTTDPTGGLGTWQSTQYTTSQNPSFDPITCASASLCLIPTGTGIYVSTDPTGGPAAWTFESGLPYSGLSCPTVHLCIGTDGSSVAVSTDPGGGAGTWKATELAPANLNAEPIASVVCTADAFCLAAMRDGSVESTHDPQAGTWSAVSGQVPGSGADGAEPSGWSSAVACPADNLCLAGVGNGDIAASTDPAGPAGSWPSQNVDGYNIPTGVSCPSDGFCVAVDDAGNVLTSRQPEDQGLWSAQHIDSAPLADVSCLTDSSCVAVDGLGGLLTSTNPADGAAAWTKLTLDGTHPFLHVSCASGPVCVAIDEAGNAFVSTDPFGGAGAWQSRQVVDTSNSDDWLTDVSCADRTVCVISARNELVVIHDPGQAAASWQSITPGAPNEYATPYPSVSCSSASFCIALSSFGVFWSTDPTGGVGAWSGAGDISSVNESSLIRCQSSTLCLAINDRALFESATPTVDQDSWGLAFDDEAAPSFYGPTAASCPSAQFCMVVGDAGYGWSGEGPDYVAPAATDSSGSGSPAVPPPPGAGAPSSGTPSTVATGAAAPATASTISDASSARQLGRVQLRTRSAAISGSRRRLRLRLACISEAVSCTGTLAVSSAGLRLARASYRLAAARSRTLTIRLGADAVRLLRRSHPHRVAISVRLTSGRTAQILRVMLSLLPN